MRKFDKFRMRFVEYVLEIVFNFSILGVVFFPFRVSQVNKNEKHYRKSIEFLLIKEVWVYAPVEATTETWKKSEY